MSLQLREGSFDGLISTADLSPLPTGAFNLANGLSTTQGLCVKLDTANPGSFVVCTGPTDICIGQITDQPLAGQTGTIRGQNAAVKNYVQLGGTVAINSPLTIDTKGRAVAATQTAAGAQPTQTLIGWATEAGTTGAIIEFYPSGVGEKF